jgi:hypothetical protein
MNAAYHKLLEEVCVRLGFCGSLVDDQPLHVDQLLPRSGSISANSFADALFKAEGWVLDGGAADQHRASVCDAFVRHMGAFEVDAQLLR